MSVSVNNPKLIPSTKVQAYDLARPFVKLLLIGLLTQIIYVTYIVAFPLISNTQAGGPAADLEILMRDYRWFAPIYTLGIFLLYYLFWQAMQTVFTIGGARDAEPAGAPFTFQFLNFVFTPVFTLKFLVLAFGLLFGFTLVWLYPITANDIFRYVLRGRVWAVYGASPMLTPPNAFPNDPYIAFAGEFGDWVSGYGPLWEIVTQAPLRLGAVDMVPGTVGLKFVVLLSYLMCAILIGWVARPEKSSSLTALTFFAWNPLILIQGPGNGHNDLVFMALLVLGLVVWQRNLWGAAALLFTLAILAKASALLVAPLFGIVLLRRQPSWGQRLLKGAGAIGLSLVTVYVVYAMLGPVSETLRGVSDMLTTRRGFAVASGVRMVLREIIPRGAESAVAPEALVGVPTFRELVPCSGTNLLVRLVSQVAPCNVAETMPRTTARHIFILFYVGLLVQLWRNKLNLVTAAFLAYFSQLMLGRTFRIWYPMWLIPLAALHLTSATFWRTFLFGLTAELSIINYFVVWRWWLRDLPWDRLGLLATSYYWPVMHLLTVPWLFGIPLLGPIFMRRWGKDHFYLNVASTKQSLASAKQSLASARSECL